MLEALTGTGLAASAGLNAYIPLLTVGLLARFSDLVTLPGGWQWLSNGWVLTILVVLLAIEVVADKVPVVDHVNDVVQTVVRPTAGGLAFGAGSGAETVTVSDPGEFFGSHQWLPIVAGVLIALGVHGVKAAARPVINAGTAGVGAPVASTVEDATSVLGSLAALLFPALVLLFLVALPGFVVWVVRRRRRRRLERRAARAARAGSLAEH
ncbi:DUF4126 domain-containing protein [Plantactinospora sonchi]|uniref:DUF4126 domain-containing protein n=1 Tax=Plantactinospora sonchi TaxID=1544735 RepID=A0ABU7RML5_9ACTN